MNQKIKVGNVYISPTGTAYIVYGVAASRVLIRNLRTGYTYGMQQAALFNLYELVGTPYNQEPVNET